jgi:arginine-tRNA-protein transferase
MKKIEQQVVTDPKDSIIQIYGTHVSECGYCKCQRPSSISYGVVAKSLGADDYLKLMLIGWRRSGTYLYKPAMYVTCCPQYTIRLEASRFVANKAQRQVARRVERFLHSGSILAEPEGQPTGKKSSDHTIGLPAASSSSKHSLTVELVPAENTEERYQLFRKYQVRHYMSFSLSTCGRLISRYQSCMF